MKAALVCFNYGHIQPIDASSEQSDFLYALAQLENKNNILGKTIGLNRKLATGCYLLAPEKFPSFHQECTFLLQKFPGNSLFRVTLEVLQIEVEE